MNVKFNVLWFEDNPTWLKTEKENIEDLLREHCLVPEIDCYNGEEIDVERITDRKYDLILMDYDLAESTTGDTIAQIIRSYKVLTDILLYSSHTNLMHDAIKKAIPELDGIYITKRDTKTFKEKVAGIIEKIIKRSEDIVNLRGFVLDNTSDFETRIAAILTSCYAKFGQDDRAVLETKMKEVIQGNKEYREKTINKYLESDDFFNSVNDNHMLTSISTRLAVVQVAIEILKNKFDMPEECCSNTFCADYMNMVGSYRNKLGHVKADESKIEISGQTVIIDEKLHEKLRHNVTEVDKKIKLLEEFVYQINAEMV